MGNYAVTHIYKPKFLRAEGEEIVYKTYSSKKTEAEDLFKSIRHLRNEGLSKKDMVILSCYRIDNPDCCLYNVKIPEDIGNIRINQASRFAECKQVRFYTIQAFKGLEAKAVIMIDVDNFADDNRRLFVVLRFFAEIKRSCTSKTVCKLRGKLQICFSADTVRAKKS
jgi:superfamily I DNA/RNA helicase